MRSAKTRLGQFIAGCPLLMGGVKWRSELTGGPQILDMQLPRLRSIVRAAVPTEGPHFVLGQRSTPSNFRSGAMDCSEACSHSLRNSAGPQTVLMQEWFCAELTCPDPAGFAAQAGKETAIMARYNGWKNLDFMVAPVRLVVGLTR